MASAVEMGLKKAGLLKRKAPDAVNSSWPSKSGNSCVLSLEDYDFCKALLTPIVEVPEVVKKIEIIPVNTGMRVLHYYFNL